MADIIAVVSIAVFITSFVGIAISNNKKRRHRFAILYRISIVGFLLVLWLGIIK